jgi:hypothetical protein
VRMTYWITPEEIRTFQEISVNRSTSTPVLSRNHLRKFIGLSADKELDLPLVALNSDPSSQDGESYISNGHIFFRAREIKHAVPLIPAQTIVFSIDFLTGVQRESFLQNISQTAMWRHLDLSIQFANRSVQIFYQNRPVTSGRGVFACTRISNAFISPVNWEVLTTEPDFHLRAADPVAPVIFDWRFFRRPEGIGLTLTLEILKPRLETGVCFRICFDPEFANSAGRMFDPAPVQSDNPVEWEFATAAPPSGEWIAGIYQIASGLIQPLNGAAP